MDDLTPLQPDGVGGEEEVSAEAKANKGYMSFFSYSAVFFMVSAGHREATGQGKETSLPPL